MVNIHGKVLRSQNFVRETWCQTHHTTFTRILIVSRLSLKMTIRIRKEPSQPAIENTMVMVWTRVNMLGKFFIQNSVEWVWENEDRGNILGGFYDLNSCQFVSKAPKIS